MNLFTGAILSAVKETIPRGRKRDYITDWNAQLQELHSTARGPREKMESCPTDDNISVYNKPKQNLLDRSSNRRALIGMNTRLPSTWKNLWKLTKLLNGDSPGKSQTVLQSEGDLIDQKEAANCLAKVYQEGSNVKLPRERNCQVRDQLTQLQKQSTSDNCMSQPIIMKEIEASIKQLKCKKAPGPDGHK